MQTESDGLEVRTGSVTRLPTAPLAAINLPLLSAVSAGQQFAETGPQCADRPASRTVQPARDYDLNLKSEFEELHGSRLSCG